MSRYVAWTILLAAALLFSVGCKPSETGPKKTGEGGSAVREAGGTTESGGAAETGGAPESGGATEAGGSATESGAEGAGAESEAAPSTETPGEAEPGATSAAEPAAPGSDTRPPEAAPAVADEFIAGIEDPRFVQFYGQMRGQLANNPDDQMAKLQLAAILQSLAQLRMGAGETDKAHAAHAESAKLAREYLATNPQVPSGAERALNVIFYNEACVRAKGNDTAGALASLESAFEWGFNDLDQLGSDEDLAAVRAMPDFGAKLDAWKAKAAEAARQHVAEEMASFQPFPFDFNVTDFDGAAHTLANYQGKVLVVDIWGTWCPPCRAELPSFIKLQETYGPQGFQMIGLNDEGGDTSEDKANQVREFIKQNGINYPCAFVDAATRDQVPDFEGYPTTLFLDRAGKVRLKAVGLHDYSYLEAVVTTLLAEGAPPASEAPAAEAPAADAPAAETPPPSEGSN